MFGGNFAPVSYAFCRGQLLSIDQNTALFALIGTTYGGDGQQTFALPDLRGRIPVGQGNGPGLSPKVIGESSGTENVTLLTQQMPGHNHAVACGAGGANAISPANNFWASDAGAESAAFGPPASINTGMSAQAVGTAGGSQPHNNMQPFLVINFIIALEGIFPSRN
jgi:microcystin-dependent protein